MNVLRKKFNLFVIVVTGTFLAALLTGSYVQKVNAKTNNFWEPNNISVINSQQVSEHQDFLQDKETVSTPQGNLSSSINQEPNLQGFVLAQAAVDLSGRWRCNDGGTYYLRQVDNQLFWYGEQNATNPNFSNVYRGVPLAGSFVVNGNISGGWVDLPKGRILSSGVLTIQIASPNSLIKVVATGGFGGSRWDRI